MSDDTRIRQLLEAMLDSDCTPEEVCRAEPELLREVRKRWEQMQRVGHQIQALFPSQSLTNRDDATTLLNAEFELPRIDGYDVQAVLGRGGMGVVFRAQQLKLNRIIALKMLLAGAYAGPQELARFRREAEAVAALRHPNIVQIYDVDDLAGRPYFTMEFVEGGSLAQLHAKLLRIARLADPDPEWRDRFRDPAVWSDPKELTRLAGDVAKVVRPPAGHQLAIIGALLDKTGARLGGSSQIC